MRLTIEDVEHVAALARLGLTEAEKERMRDQLSGILEHIAALEEIDTAAIPPTAQTIAFLRAADVGAIGPVVGYGGRIFLDRPELRERVDGIYLGDEDRDTVEIVQRMVPGIEVGSR